MASETNQSYLLNEQYKDSSNFAARVRLNAHFKTNPGNFHRWVFERLQLAPGSWVLELGCGPALFWRSNLDQRLDRSMSRNERDGRLLFYFAKEAWRFFLVCGQEGKVSNDARDLGNDQCRVRFDPPFRRNLERKSFQSGFVIF